MNIRLTSAGRLVQWSLLVVALLAALGFIVAVFYVLWGFFHSFAGVPLRYVLLVVVPLVVSVAATVAVARLEQRSIGCAGANSTHGCS